MVHLRAALMSGGIIWQLALEAMTGDDGLAILAGPLDQYSALQVLFQLHHPKQLSYTDDGLSEYGTDMICGVYKVFTGIYKGPLNVLQISG